tara:strand:- start:218 stop:706 length:489 start_codon:yes stop_codon:yes gene_type:complete
MRVVKNFLKEDYFNKLKAAFVDHNPDLPFYIQQRVAFETGPIDKKHFYFTHLLFNNSIKSSYYDLVKPFIWEILKVKALIRVKVNLYPRTDKLIHHDPHNDHDFKHKALVFSLNTCDGGTRIGKKFIPSIANQALFFDGSVMHNSTTCTNKQARLNINFNYF